MFTGLIDHQGLVNKCEKHKTHLGLWINTEFNNLQQGESIAVNGICLTVANIDGNDFYCELSPETLAKTNARHFDTDQQVNLERALQMQDRIGGHFVTGHIDQVAHLHSKNEIDGFIKLEFINLGNNIEKYLLEKGSVAINGVSLTINNVIDDGFDIMLIPETIKKTNLTTMKENVPYNIEFDYLAKIIAKQYLIGNKGNNK